jgi:Spy/CpxP family protein refolding chaperone
MALFAVLAGGLGLTACRHGSPEARVDHISDKIADKLEFNESQKSILAEIKAEVKTDMESEKQYRLALKDEIEKMILSPDLDQARLKDLFNQRHQRLETKADKYIAKVAALHKTLTSEQRQTIIEKINKFAKHIE